MEPSRIWCPLRDRLPGGSSGNASWLAGEDGRDIEAGAFKLKSVVPDELGCLSALASSPAPAPGEIVAERNVFGGEAVAISPDGAVAYRGEVRDGLLGRCVCG